VLLRILRGLFAGRGGDAAPAPRADAVDGPQAVRQRLARAVQLHGAGDLAGARRLYQEVIESHASNADAHHMLGLLEHYSGDQRAAEASMRQAIAHEPGYAVLHRHLAMVLERRGDISGAIECCARALALDPADPETYSHMGNVLVMARRVDEAVASYRRASELDPTTPRFRFNLSLALLLLGRYEEGWEKYEFRWDGSAELAGRRREFAAPQWRGEPLAGRTLLLHAEQAFGDTLQFARYAALVARANAGARVVLECQPELARLLVSIGHRVEVIAREQPLPPFDLHCPLLSLPLVFRTTLETIPAELPYLAADPADVETWCRRLAGPGGFRVGLVWSGKARAMNRWHNLALSDLAPLFQVGNARFFSLQKTQTGYAMDSECAGTSVADHTALLDDFADTAALISNLDLVISVDTSVAHLAGALGKPVWLLARYDADWRWLLERTDSPWYLDMTIFRQRAAGDWAELVPRVASALRERAG
jgi:Flp pilus assembly protein TadD